MKTLKEGLLRNVGVGKVKVIENWLSAHGIQKYHINKDYTIDVEEFVILKGDFEALPDYIQFGQVDSMIVLTNKTLTSLRGFPQNVRDLSFAYCPKLSTLDFDPSCRIVTLSLHQCDHITSLSSIPEGVITHGLNCGCKNLKTLKGCPQSIKRLRCDGIDKLTSLEGVPEHMEEFSCRECNGLKTLMGSPRTVDRDFDCFRCINLRSLEGGPEAVGIDFICSGCSMLSSLKGCPKTVGRDFYCKDCPNIPYGVVLNYCKVSGKIYR